MSKCCFMHFQPKKYSECNSCSRSVPFVSNSDISKAIYINGQKLDEVSETKFLGVIIDNKLEWSAHIHYLKKKLRSAAAVLSRVRHWIPEIHYSKIYHALFESHLTYGISVWGGVSNAKMNSTFTIGEEMLGPEFFAREHTKPLFSKQELLAAKNLYHYFCSVEVFKILKFRLPINLFETYSHSNREESLSLVTPVPSIQFIYKSSKAWNSVYKKMLTEPHSDLTTKISHFKTKLKALLLSKQKEGDIIEWNPSNFKLY